MEDVLETPGIVDIKPNEMAKISAEDSTLAERRAKAFDSPMLNIQPDAALPGGGTG